MEQLILIFLILFGSIHGQDYQELEYEEAITESGIADEQHLKQLPEEKIINEEINGPERQRSRRYLEDMPDSSSSSASDIIQEISHFKKQLDHLQDQQQPYEDQNSKIKEIKAKLQNIIDLLKGQHLEVEPPQPVRRFAQKEEKCDRRRLNGGPPSARRYVLKHLRQSPPKPLSTEYDNVIVLAPNPKKMQRKALDHSNPKKIKQKFLRKHISHYSKAIDNTEEAPPESEAPNATNEKLEFYLPHQSNKNEMSSNDLQNTLEKSKNVRCIKTQSMIICSASIQ